MFRILLFMILLAHPGYAQQKVTIIRKRTRAISSSSRPTAFYNSFSLNIPPVLHIRSGDTVSTETIDASGHDKNGAKRQMGGNPLTGPFYIDDCVEGDVLQITLATHCIKPSLCIHNRIFCFEKCSGQYQQIV